MLPTLTRSLSAVESTLLDSNRGPNPTRPTSFDMRYRQHLCKSRLNTAFLNHYGARSHSFLQDKETTPSTSRIDDWLCPDGTLDSHIIHTEPQILQSPYTQGSDHSPVLLQVPHAALFSCPVPESPPAHSSSPKFIRPFPKDSLLAWQRLSDAWNGVRAHNLTNALTQRLANAQQDPASPITAQEFQQWYDDIFSCIDNSFQIAFDTLPMTSAHAPPQSPTNCMRTSFLPRVLMRKFTRHVSNAQALRAVMHGTMQFLNTTSTRAHVCSTSAYRHLRKHLPEAIPCPLTRQFSPLHTYPSFVPSCAKNKLTSKS